jgi:hypothetical protein
MKKLFVALVLVMLTGIGAPTQAALVLYHSGGGPVADINFPVDPFAFDVVYDSFGGDDMTGGVAGF